MILKLQNNTISCTTPQGTKKRKVNELYKSISAAERQSDGRTEKYTHIPLAL